MDRKKTVISNYIPHKTPKITNYYIWSEEYFKNLVDIFEIIRNIINVRHSKNDINSNEAFNVFSKMVFNSSSKHIRKY